MEYGLCDVQSSQSIGGASGAVPATINKQSKAPRVRSTAYNDSFPLAPLREDPPPGNVHSQLLIHSRLPRA